MDVRGMKLRMLKRTFFTPEVCAGKEALQRLGCLDPARVLLVIGPSAVRTGLLEKLRAHLKDATAYESLQLSEPTAAAIQSSAQQAAAFAPEWIAAVGGGAVIDAAKFLWAKYEHPGLEFTAPAGIPALRAKARFLAIPTTSGSGSESSQAAVLTTGTGAKLPFVSPQWLPDLTILDPSLTLTLPRDITVSTGFDALAHAVEAAVSSLSTAMLRPLCATAVKEILHWLPEAAANLSSFAAREGMQNAAYLAGLCQSAASTGAAHALSHATSMLFHTPHAAATGFYLLPAMRMNLAKNPALYDGLLPNLLTAIEDLAARTGLARTFPALLGRAIGGDERKALAEAAAKDVCLRTNPSRVSVAEMEALLEAL